MTLEGVIVEILVVGVMNQVLSMVECPNWRFASWDFREKNNPPM